MVKKIKDFSNMSFLDLKKYDAKIVEASYKKKKKKKNK